MKFVESPGTRQLAQWTCTAQWPSLAEWEEVRRGPTLDLGLLYPNHRLYCIDYLGQGFATSAIARQPSEGFFIESTVLALA